jgi:hypothetical protein
VDIPIDTNVSAISPNTSVNFLGGDIMNITGDSFGYNTSAISVTYTDGTACTVTAASMTSITCVNARFTTEAANS